MKGDVNAVAPETQRFFLPSATAQEHESTNRGQGLGPADEASLLESPRGLATE